MHLAPACAGSGKGDYETHQNLIDDLTKYSDMIPMACYGLVSPGKRDKDPCCPDQISLQPS
jgi:hypothetical protein